MSLSHLKTSGSKAASAARLCLACATSRFYNDSKFDLSCDLRLWGIQRLKVSGVKSKLQIHFADAERESAWIGKNSIGRYKWRPAA